MGSGGGRPRSPRKRRKRSSRWLRVMPAARASFAHDPLEDSGPSAPGVARDESRQRCGVGKPERLRLLYGPLDVMAVEDGRQVEERARDRGHRDAVDLGDLVRRETGLVSSHAPAPPHSCGSGDVGSHRVGTPDAPERRRRAMTEDGAATARQHGGHPHPGSRQPTPGRPSRPRGAPDAAAFAARGGVSRRDRGRARSAEHATRLRAACRQAPRGGRPPSEKSFRKLCHVEMTSRRPWLHHCRS
jgi:hypothetical protein